MAIIDDDFEPCVLGECLIHSVGTWDVGIYLNSVPMSAIANRKQHANESVLVVDNAIRKMTYGVW